MINMQTIQERRENLRARIYYWQNVRKAAIPGGKTEKWANERIRLLQNAIAELDAYEKMEAQANAEKSEDHLGAVD